MQTDRVFMVIETSWNADTRQHDRRRVVSTLDGDLAFEMARKWLCRAETRYGTESPYWYHVEADTLIDRSLSSVFLKSE